MRAWLESLSQSQLSGLLFAASLGVITLMSLCGLGT